MIESKVVPFAQNVEFLRSRAMKQKRSGNPLDALELLRRAGEAGLSSEEFCGDMSEVYADMNCHMDSRVMSILRIFAQPEDDAAYFQLAQANMEMGALPEAEKAYNRYLTRVAEGEDADTAREDMADIQLAYRMWKQIDRRTRRKVRRMREVRRRQLQRDFTGADRIFEKELSHAPGDQQLRINRAMSLCMQGDMDAARRELDHACADISACPGGIIILAAQVYYRLGDGSRADALLKQLDRAALSLQEWQMLMALQADMQRDDQAYICGGEILRQQPYDRRMLHLMAVTAFRLGKDRDVVGGYWQRILRIDPEDDVAQWHLQQLRAGELCAEKLYDAYALPPAENARRGRILLELLDMSEDQLRAAWEDSSDVRHALHWALFSENPALVEPAIRLLEGVAGEKAARYLAEFVARTRMDMEFRLHAVQAIKKIAPQQWPGVGEYMQMQMLPGLQEALEGMPVAYRQTVQLAKDVLEENFHFTPDAALALQCGSYLSRLDGHFDRMRDLRCTAAALAYIELKAAGRDVQPVDVAVVFECGVRKVKYYIELLRGASEKRDDE